MDVRCERCKTEYEFDDARITEAGVTVKCTQCSHVFKVKKKALVVTVPVKPDEVAGAATASEIAAPPQPAREWKVRQSNGNTFTFKELTTLQKWIVERKVARDDEISVNGATWKRLGDIGELATFFQVVEDALKAAQLQALQAAQAQLPPAAAPRPTPDPIPVAAQPAPVQAVVLTQAPAATPGAVPQAVVIPVTTFPASPPPVESTPAVPEPGPEAAANAAPRTTSTHAVRSAMRPEAKRSGAGGWLVAVLVIALLGGGGYAGYTYVWLPMQKQRAETAQAVTALSAEAARAQREREEQQRLAEEERLAAEEQDAAEKVAEGTAPVVTAPEALDAGTPPTTIEAASGGDTPPAQASEAAAGDAQVATAKAEEKADEEKPREAVAKKAPPRDFDWYMAYGDRQRERGRYDAALDAYGSASDLKPDRAEPVTGRALVMLDMGNKLQAEAAFLQALKLNPRYAVAAMGLAETYRMLDKKEEAIRYYERYLDLLPDGPEANVARSALKRLKE